MHGSAPDLISQRSESEHVLGWVIISMGQEETRAPAGLIFTWKLIKDGGGRSAGKTTLRHGARPAPTPRPQHAAVAGKEKLFSQSTTSRCIASPRHGSFAPSAAACCVRERIVAKKGVELGFFS